MEVRFHVERGSWASFEQLFRKAADFAAKIGPERLINISHSEDQDDGVVTVWYWSRDPFPTEGVAAAEAERAGLGSGGVAPVPGTGDPSGVVPETLPVLEELEELRDDES